MVEIGAFVFSFLSFGNITLLLGTQMIDVEVEDAVLAIPVLMKQSQALASPREE